MSSPKKASSTVLRAKVATPVNASAVASGKSSAERAAVARSPAPSGKSTSGTSPSQPPAIGSPARKSSTSAPQVTASSAATPPAARRASGTVKPAAASSTLGSRVTTPVASPAAKEKPTSSANGGSSAPRQSSTTQAVATSNDAITYSATSTANGSTERARSPVRKASTSQNGSADAAAAANGASGRATQRSGSISRAASPAVGDTAVPRRTSSPAAGDGARRSSSRAASPGAADGARRGSTSRAAPPAAVGENAAARRSSNASPTRTVSSNRQAAVSGASATTSAGRSASSSPSRRVSRSRQPEMSAECRNVGASTTKIQTAKVESPGLRHADDTAAAASADSQVPSAEGPAQAEPVAAAAAPPAAQMAVKLQVVREVVRPPNQRALKPEQFDEEVARVLVATNPHTAAKSPIRFHIRDNVWQPETASQPVTEHYTTEGRLIHRSAPQAQQQLEAEAKAKDDEEARLAKAEAARIANEDENGQQAEPLSQEQDNRRLRNQFNFADRSAQTRFFARRERGMVTEPPPTARATGSCSQWEIYDAYMADQEAQRQTEELNKRAAAARKAGASERRVDEMLMAELTEPKAAKGRECGPMRSERLRKATHILERMVNQNTCLDLAMDFKYWEDQSDALRPQEGTLLPLWRFSHKTSKRKAVTAVAWNPHHVDLFAVGYGSFDFVRQGGGAISCFTLKNPAAAEYHYVLDTGVMCLDFNPQQPHLLAAGCYDGSVAVFDLRYEAKEPVCRSNVMTGKHADIVWGVSWRPADAATPLSFTSISADGHVTLWTLSKNKLLHQELMQLRPAGKATGLEASAADVAALPDDLPINLLSGCSFDFNQEQQYLVGTEEGAILKCSMAYDSEYLQTFGGHDMAVYTLRWNPLHPRTFLSASADWTVQLWDESQPQEAILSFDLGTAVGDVAWAPYASTIFAAANGDGKVYVYDLKASYLNPLCAQKLARKGKLTKLAFNPRHPVLLVGDDRGCATVVKLSPNLRQRAPAPDDNKLSQPELETAKMDAILQDIADRGVYRFEDSPPGEQAAALSK